MKRVDTGSCLVDQAGHTMEQIVSSVRQVAAIMDEITSASQEQSTGIAEVNRTVRGRPRCRRCIYANHPVKTVHFAGKYETERRFLACNKNIIVETLCAPAVLSQGQHVGWVQG